jgi:uncharacterized membrane protein
MRTCWSAQVQTRVVSNLQYSDSVVIDRPAHELYDMISDVTRMGEWSPVCRACWWDEDSGPQPAAWFTGRNETPERTWETRSVVDVAEPGREFAFLVNGGWVRWAYTFEPVDGGTQVTESWRFLPAGQAGFRERYGAEAEAQIDKRVTAAHAGIPRTLAAIKAVAEAE